MNDHQMMWGAAYKGSNAMSVHYHNSSCVINNCVPVSVFTDAELSARDEALAREAWEAARSNTQPIANEWPWANFDHYWAQRGRK